MNLYTIDTGFFKLDGGAMFGVVPKTLWSKHHPPDEKNLCTWAMRCLLVETGGHLVLVDNGLGDKQDAKFFSHYQPHGHATLVGSLKKHGFAPDDITDVFLTHLHFDHCGGSIQWNSKRDGYEPAFKNAIYWSNQQHWEWATKPNAREKASFLKENILPIQESGQLKFVPSSPTPFSQGEGASLRNGIVKDIFPGFDVLLVNGHTESMMIPHLRYKERTIAYMADLMPSVHHLPVAWVMAYDTRPLLTLHEKAAFLETAANEDMVLFFEHDNVNECCTLKNEDGRVKLDRTLALSEL